MAKRLNERVQCEISLIRYVPDPVKSEFVNIGVLLREAGRPETALVRFTKDWARVRCIDPEADTATLEALEIEIRRSLQEADGVLVKAIQDSFSHRVQVTSAKACLAESMAAEMDLAMQLHVEGRKREGAARRSGRLAIHARMRSEFERAGVWDLLRKRISAASYTRPGDPLRIDCGYRPNGTIRMFHAVSLEGDSELAKVLAFSAPALAEGVRRVEQAELELTAIVQPLAQTGLKTGQENLEEDERLAHYRFSVETMEAQKIRVLTTSQLAAVADTARRELRL